jgi:hypothetical protein
MESKDSLMAPEDLTDLGYNKSSKDIITPSLEEGTKEKVEWIAGKHISVRSDDSVWSIKYWTGR